VEDVVILGSTGSIGTQAADIVSRHADRFRVTGLAASGTQIDVLADQVGALCPGTVALADPAAAALRQALAVRDVRTPAITTGPTAVADLAGSGATVVLNAITGYAGLEPTLAALAAGSRLALANKESLVVGGDLVTGAAKPGQITPVDSEHSAIAQALASGRADEVRRLILTASGGPFRGRTRADLAGVTPAQALAHPTWQMGRVVTINSATLVNKGLELIEAVRLFGVGWDDVEVVVHPQSQVHSMVEFRDGSTIAQCSPPDMRLPIALGLSWPDRLGDVTAGFDWRAAQDWTFEPLDEATFPAVGLARRVGRLGGTVPAVFNAANEVCVDAFCEARLGFLGIVDVVTGVVDAYCATGRPQPDTLSLGTIRTADAWARATARTVIERTA